MAKHALLVGINEHRNPRANLRGCVPDMESLASLLTNNYDFKSGNITMVTDSDATKSCLLYTSPSPRD